MKVPEEGVNRLPRKFRLQERTSRLKTKRTKYDC